MDLWRQTARIERDLFNVIRGHIIIIFTELVSGS